MRHFYNHPLTATAGVIPIDKASDIPVTIKSGWHTTRFWIGIQWVSRCSIDSIIAAVRVAYTAVTADRNIHIPNRIRVTPKSFRKRRGRVFKIAPIIAADFWRVIRVND